MSLTTRIGAASIVAGLTSVVAGLWTLLSAGGGVSHPSWIEVLAFGGIVFGISLVAAGGWLSWLHNRVPQVARRRVGRLIGGFLAALVALVLLVPWTCSVGLSGGTTGSPVVCRNLIGMTFSHQGGPRGGISQISVSALVVPIVVGLAALLLLGVLYRGASTPRLALTSWLSPTGRASASAEHR